MAWIYQIIKKIIKQFAYMFPAHAVVFVLTWFGVGPSPIPILSFFNLPFIYILVRKSPTLINFPLLLALVFGAALAHNEPTTSPMESYFENFSILTIVGLSIAIFTLVPMILTKFITIKINQRWKYFTHNVNSRLIFPVIWTGSWSLFRRYSPLGSWGDWSYTIDNSGYTGDPIVQIASIGGLSAINLFLALWMQVISDFFILRHRIEKSNRNIVLDEETRLIPHQISDNDDNIKIYKKDLSTNYYLRAGMVIAILSCFVIGGERLNHIENNVDHIPTEIVGCVIPSYTTSYKEMLKKTVTLVTNYQAKIVLWSESAVALRNQSEYNEFLNEAYYHTYKYKFYLGLTYTIPDDQKKKNMLTFIGNNNETLFEYQKTHPVPLVESYSTVSGPGHLSLVNIQLPKKEKDQPKEYNNLNVSGAICLDMDFPELLGQAAGANLVLSPAQTWSARVGLQHLRMSSVRAIENGYWILRCDGDGASGLIDPYGRVRHVQIASNDHINMFSWEMPLVEEKIETYYASYGEFLVWAVFVLLGICELAWYLSWTHAEEEMNSYVGTAKEFIESWQKWMEEKYDAIFDREELLLSEQQSLI
ncbi:carbon-nitrogen hydrolase [Glomus cerebriforme]|uniref:Carbon-nitrogen hydrolase n=1 Tax=Glomus cerebriforme TaxID=658196 RepID=A0A397TGQ6_9GLOM|nr:carbon-nitrogen hydrolase [Glomus cerebriforme]